MRLSAGFTCIGLFCGRPGPKRYKERSSVLTLRSHLATDSDHSPASEAETQTHTANYERQTLVRMWCKLCKMQRTRFTWGCVPDSQPSTRSEQFSCAERCGREFWWRRRKLRSVSLPPMYLSCA